MTCDAHRALRNGSRIMLLHRHLNSHLYTKTNKTKTKQTTQTQKQTNQHSKKALRVAGLQRLDISCKISCGTRTPKILMGFKGKILLSSEEFLETVASESFSQATSIRPSCGRIFCKLRVETGPTKCIAFSWFWITSERLPGAIPSCVFAPLHI